LAKLPILVPPPSQRYRIEAILGALDDKIDLNRRMNETLEAMARETFKDWFVDFGPTRAKMEGRIQYLAPEIWTLFPDRLDGEGKPKGWRGGTLLDVATLNPESWSRSTYPGHIDYVDLANTKWGTIEATERHERDAAPSRAQRILRNGDTIVGTVRPGNGSYALVGENGLTGSTGFAVLRSTRTTFREFVYLAATSPTNIERLSHLADGAAYPAVRPEIVAATEIIFGVDDGVLEAFHMTTAPLIDLIEANKQESRTLAITRDLLLPKLMAGEIQLLDAEKPLEAVA
jgi:type I restriction enzyme S subunit